VTATELARDDNPRWLATLVTALPVALAALFVSEWSRPDTRRLPPAVPMSKPAPAVPAPAEPNPDTTLARAP
jgi:hypothetical protein